MAPIQGAATPTDPTTRATASCGLAGARPAATRSAGAPSMAASGQLPMPSTSTGAEMEIRALLAIPRPRTRAECVDGPRPCPWVGCSQHLLLEVGATRASRKRLGAAHQSPGLVLNLHRSGGGRRRHLPSSCAAAELVRVWIDDALEMLWSMPDSCALDVADRGASSGREVASHVGRSMQGVRAVRRAAIARLAQERAAQTSAGPAGPARRRAEAMRNHAERREVDGTMRRNEIAGIAEITGGNPDSTPPSRRKFRDLGIGGNSSGGRPPR